MAFYKTAQPIHFDFEDLVVHDEPGKPTKEEVIEAHLPEEEGHNKPILMIELPSKDELPLKFDKFPGAPEADDNLEVEDCLEVSDEASEEDAVEVKEKDLWDWEERGLENFMHWVQERMDSIPRHSGKSTAGVERAISYLKKLDKVIGQAIQEDLKGLLDIDKIENLREEIDEGIVRLEERSELLGKKFKSKKKKRADEENSDIKKEAQKIAGVQGIMVTVPLLISRVARVCINGNISAGHSIEDLFERQVKAYKLDNREQAEVMQLLSDMGYAIRRDRGIMLDEKFDPASSDNMDFAANYQA